MRAEPDHSRAVRMAVLSLLLAGSVQAGARTMTLINPDRPAPIIVIAPEAGASEKFAAQEMATYLGKMTGRKIPVVDDSNIPKGKVIALGRSKLTASIDVTGLGCEQFITDIQPGKLIIIGGRREAKPGQGARDAGTLYGVYEFLDRLGVRWYRPEQWGEHVPRKSSIDLKVGRTVSSVPSYPLLRVVSPSGLSMYWHQNTEEEKELAAKWSVRNRMNFWDSTLKGDANFYYCFQTKIIDARDAALEAKLGGKENYEWDHQYRYIIPPEEYFASHPEYFALIKGKRDRSDLCLGNPELQRVFADNLIVKAKANPHLSAMSVEPSDCLGSTCECDRCKAMDLPPNTRLEGAGSNRVAAFSNLIAGMVAKEAPWAKVLWLGYSSHTAAPTNLRQLEPNTIAMLAPINQWSDWTKSLTDTSAPSCRWGWSNADLVKTLGDWAALKPSSLMVWEYYDGYGWPGPLPMTHSVADRWRNYRKLGIKGIMNHSFTSWGPQGLDRYMSVKLAWNPDLDVDKELKLYYTNYYGPAAKPMKAYHERLFRAFETAQYPVQSGGRGMHLLFTPALVKELGKYIGNAQSLVRGQPLYERRMKGVWAGYEFARRVSEILVLKKKHGVPVSSSDRAGNLAPEIARPAFVGSGNYLQSVEAEKAYGDLIRWVRSVNTEDHVFEMIRDQSQCKITEDVAETIFSTKGWAESIWIAYLPNDILMNCLNADKPEEVLLKDF
ncbi:MAG: DUF4838 domain-containing protein [Armatimonadetes bacterium]|nr:DUF4838 domain-containing protein [Armatimonadota bacterium]